MGKKAYLIDDAGELQQDWITDSQRVGVTAGASAPEILVQNVVAKLKAWGGQTITEKTGIEERVVFSLPKDLRRSA